MTASYVVTESTKKKHVNARHNDTIKRLRILVVGKDETGKSALTVRFLTKRFIGEYARDIETIYSRKVTVSSREKITVEMKDTAGQITVTKREADLHWADAVILVYSITDHSSFVTAAGLKRQIDEVTDPTRLPCLLIGNKTDMNERRQVPRDDGVRFATRLGCMFSEMSVAEQHEHVTEVIYKFINEECLVRTFDNFSNGISSPKRTRASHLWTLIRSRDWRDRNKTL